MNAKLQAAEAHTAAQLSKLDAKMDRMLVEMHKSHADHLEWTVALVCMIVGLGMSMLNFMMRSYIDDAVGNALSERRASTALPSLTARWRISSGAG